MLDSVIIGCPSEDAAKPYLCLDAGYVGETAKREVEDRDCIPYVRPRGEEIEEKDKNPDFRQGGGLLKFATPGLTALESSWYGMKKWSGVISACSCWPLPSSSYEKSSDKIRAILFMDKF